MIKEKEVVDWIMKQPRDRLCNMKENLNNDYNTGCIGVQFGREKWPDRQLNGCGFTHWSFQEGEPIYIEKSFLFFAPNARGIFTYGEIQDYLKNR